MPAVTSATASAVATPSLEARSRERTVLSLLVAAATVLVVLALSVFVLVQPGFTHWALRSAGSAELLRISPAQVEAISDRTIGELLAGPGTFVFPLEAGGPPFYDRAEAAHLGDARLLFWLLVGGGFAGGLLLAAALAGSGREAWPWRAISAGGATLAIALVVVGAGFVVAFDAAFELFHRLFFPQGNWAFDPTTERIVLLYPTAFWQLAVGGLGVLGIAGGTICWAVGRAQAGRIERAARVGRVDRTSRGAR
ncbi:MAG TPA: DUF1461 domain-containing protein [Candidatus Limnocylindrales bacterium]|jgi:integral membrane protein (TIGR01906 family)|nr:DUF1461 domain-containing protein [Candidatus Limnocylindrales bacterium]